jgi:hypothetical protein
MNIKESSIAICLSNEIRHKEDCSMIGKGISKYIGFIAIISSRNIASKYIR